MPSHRNVCRPQLQCCVARPRAGDDILPRQGCGAAVFLLAVFVAKEAESRLPPKFLKVASGAGKALYARGYGYNVIPIPQKLLLQSNFARREVHGHRPPRRNKRPPRRNKRPQPGYASRYQDYRPGRKRRPLLYPDPPEYHEQELDEEFDYEDQPDKEYDDFVSKHAELYANGYSTRTKPKRHRDEVTAYTENSRPVYIRKPLKRLRPSTKLYSATIGSRPGHHRDHSDFEDEDDENINHNKGNKRKRYRNKDNYRETDEEDNYDYNFYSFKKNQPPYWNPDDIYHDRKYDATQEKFTRVIGTSNSQKRQPAVMRSEWSNRPKKITNVEQSVGENQNLHADRNRWRDSPYQYRWKNIVDQNRSKEQKQDYSKSNQRWNEPGPASTGKWSKVEEMEEEEESKELDIITSQNAGKWEGSRTTEGPQEKQEDWMKEHSVGYGIEIDSGQKKKRLESDPDVVYGQAGRSKPRVPDLRYDQPENSKLRGPDLGYVQPGLIPDIGYEHGLEMVEENLPRRLMFHS